MRSVPLEEVTIDASNSLLVRPQLPSGEDFAFIYRTATGVRWIADSRALAPVAGSTPTHLEWFRRICDATRGEYGCELAVTPHTRWVNVPADLRKALEAATRETVA